MHLEYGIYKNRCISIHGFCKYRDLVIKRTKGSFYPQITYYWCPIISRLQRVAHLLLFLRRRRFLRSPLPWRACRLKIAAWGAWGAHRQQ